FVAPRPAVSDTADELAETWRSVRRGQASRSRLEQMAIPFHVVAVDVVTGEELLLSVGRMHRHERRAR
ncbi:MAG: hypothetical protein ACYCXW_13700, partial [Solirubrobacteraceae bacterium]